ncbi:hypothetical protein [Variovorax boronicumulans]|uniref:hypothetical protein n=1 Tax=Variovorax boronicumulans TaxID=436515 RepID=UPI001F36A7CB|nr:hypothetical protein [Variovorax boronicumulans]
MTIGAEPGPGVPNKGVLMPRVALADASTWGLAAPTPVEGMVVFNTTAGTSANGLGVGLMTWKNGRWVNVDETPYLHVNSTAVGNSTQANSGAIGANSVAIGPDAKALANDTVAMGNGAEAHKLGDIAIGRAAIASGGDRLTGPTENWSSVAVGTYASATEGNSVALGGSAKAEGRGTALGSRAEAGYDTVAIGTFAGMGRPAKTDPNDFSNSLNTFVGSGSGASGNGARNSYVGNQAGFAVQGDENAGMGYGAGGLSSGNRNVAVGQRAGQFVTGDQNINQGTMAGFQAKGSNNIALGTLASANLALAAQDPNAPISQAAVQAASLAAQTEYMGFLATRGVTEAGLADGTYTLDASGNVIEASSGNVLVTAAELQTSVTQAFQRNGVAGIDASRTTAIGHLSRATGDDAVALGSSAVAGDKAAVAIGTASKAFGVSSVAVGDSAFAKGEASIAMGKGAQANGTQSISIGTGNVVNGNNSGAIGDPSTIDGANSYSVGNNNTLGAAASNTFVLGNNVNVNVANATALGDSTSVTVADGVALGSKSVASTDKGVAGFDPATGKASTDTSATWKSTLGAVSVGGNGQTRQITNVAAGTQATDAVNVAQLKAAQTHYYSVNDNGTQGGNYDNKGATGLNAMASGVDAKAGGDHATAVGHGATAGGHYAIAQGYQANAAGANGVAIGTQASAAKGGTVAIGASAGKDSTVLTGTFIGAGAGNKSAGADITAIGNNAGQAASGNSNTFIGATAGSSSEGDLNSFIGAGAGIFSKGTANSAFGNLAGANTEGDSNAAWGFAAGAFVKGDGNIGMGTSAGASVVGSGNAAIGQGAGLGTQGDANLAIGAGAGSIAKGNSNVALGQNAGLAADGNENIALGQTAGALVSGNRNLAIGSAAGLAGDVAAGNITPTTASDTIALGTQSFANAERAIAIGTGAQALGTQSISIGTGNVVNGNNSGAIGDPTVIDGANSYSVGNNNTLGAAANNTFVLGNNVNVNVANATALGDSTSVTVADGVALGSKSVASTDKGVAGFDPATGLASTDTSATWKSTLGAVSVGGNGQTRQITNVAAGTQATDAVNVAQLKAGQTHYYSVNDNGVQGGNYANDGATGINALAAGVGAQANGERSVSIGYLAGVGASAGLAGQNNVGIGTEAGGGVVGSSNTAVGSAAGKDVAGSSNAAFGIAAGQGVQGDYNLAMGVYSGIGTKGTYNTAIGGSAGQAVNGNDNIAMGDLSGASVVGDANIGIGALAGAGTTGSSNIAIGSLAGIVDTATFAGITANNTVSIGNSAVASKDDGVAVGHGAQAAAVNSVALGADSKATQDAAALALKDAYVPAGATTVAGTAPVGEVSVGSAGKERRITNVAAGSDDTDAVNVSQLKGAQTHYYSVNDNGTQGGNYDNKGATGINAIAAGVDAVAAGVGTVAVGNLAGSGSTAAGNSHNTFVGYAAGRQVAGADNTAVGNSAGVSVTGGNNTALGLSAGARVTGDSNIGIGVNGGAVTTGFSNVGIGSSAGQGTNGAFNVALGGLAGGGVQGSANVAIGLNAGESVSASNTVAIGTRAKATGDSGVSIGTDASATYANAVALGANSATASDLATLSANAAYVPPGATSVAGAVPVGEVSVGGVGAERRITNVAAGAVDTDAVNVSQLKAVDATANAGWNVAANGEATGGNVAPGAKVDFSNSDSNIAITRTGTNLDFKLADDVKVNNSVTVGQSVLNTTGLTVNDGTTTTAVAAGGVTSGTVKLSGVTNDIQGLSNKTLTDPSFATVGRAATEEQLKIVNDTASAGWNVAANGEATGGNVAPGGKVDFSNSDSNVTITRSGANLDFKLADDVKVNNSVTVGQSVLNTTGLTVNNGTTTTAVAAGGVTSGSVNLSGVTNDIQGLSNKTLTDPSFATVGRGATEEQLKIVNDTASAGWNVAANGEATGGNVAPGGKVDFSNSDSNVTITRSGTNLDFKLADDVKVNNSVTVGQSVLNTTGLTVNDGAGNVTTTSATGTTVTNGTTTTAMAAGGVTSGTVNLSGVTNDIQGLSNKTLTDPSFATVGRAATEEQLKIVNDTASAGWNVAANGEATGGNVAPGGKVDFSNSDNNIAITRTGTNLDFKLADDVKVNNSVTVGQSVLNTTGLTVNNGTTTTAVAAGGVTSGSVNLSGVTNDIQGLSNTTLTDPSFATVGRAATEEQLKKVNDTAGAGWNVAANGEATGGNVAPGGKVDFSNSDSNIAITRSGTNLDFKLADDVKVNNSVTVGQSVLNTTGLTVNDGTTTTAVAAGGVTSGTVKLSGVSNDIQGLSNKTLTDPSFATVGRGATEEQLKIVNDTASAGWNVAANGEATGGNVAPGGKVDFSNSDSNIAITRTGTNLDFKLADDVKVNNSVTVGQSVLNTTGLTVNNGTTTTAVAAGGVTSGTVKLSGVSNDIQGLSNKTLTDPSFATVGRAATEEQLKLVDATASKGWNLSANGEATPQNIAPGGTANFANGDNMVVTRNGNTLTVATAKDVKFDSVTTGDTVMNNAGVTVGPNVTLGATGLTIVGGPSVTTAGVDAGGKVITNVAPGVAGTDAVNVSQLKDTVAESKTKYYSVNSAGGGNENNDGATGADAIAAGKDAQATAVNAVAMGTAAQAAGVSATSIGNAAWAMGDRSTAVGYFSTADGIDSAAFGAWARAGGNGSVAAGAASNASGVASVAMGAASAAVGDVSVAVGAGSTATATGGAALGAGSVADRAAGVKGYVPPEATAAQADAIAATTSTTGAVGVGDAAHGVFRQITGVAAGSAPSDAVNVAQLQAVASQAAAAGSKWITGSPTTYVAPTSTGTDSTAVGSGAAVKADQGVAIGTGAVVTTKNSVALGNDATTAEAKPTKEVTLQGTTYQFAGTKPVGVVSVGSKDAERQLTNVAAGEISATSTDAVNGSQLYATNQAINNMTTGGGGIKYFHANSKAADSNAAGAESVAIGPNAVALGNNAIATGNNAQAKAAGSIALGANSTASSANSVALGDGAVANRAGMNGQREMFSNTVVQSAQGAVSVGSAGNERQITNVAGGTQATDAVNVRQLQAVQQSAVRYDTNVDGSVNYNSVTMGNGASTGPVTVQNVAPGVAPTDAVNVQQLNQAGAAGMAYTDARTNALGNELRNTAKNAYAGVAAAMAVQMPGTSVPGKTVMRVGYGTFKGESAVGISFRRTAENNGWSVTGGVGMSRAGAAATVGAEWVFN